MEMQQEYEVENEVQMQEESIQRVFESEIEELDNEMQKKLHDLILECVIHRWSMSKWKLRSGRLLSKSFDKEHRVGLAEYIYKEVVEKSIKTALKEHKRES